MCCGSILLEMVIHYVNDYRSQKLGKCFLSLLFCKRSLHIQFIGKADVC